MTKTDILAIDVAEFFSGMLKKYRIQPKYLDIDISRIAYLDTYDVLSETVAQLQQMGFRVVLDGFDGGVASCEVHINKPDPKIYKALLDKYSLKAEECVFIDDRLETVQAAFALGFAGVQMKASVGTQERSLATCNVTLR